MLVVAGLWREEEEEVVEVELVGVCMVFFGEEMDAAGVGVPFKVEAESSCGGQELLRSGHGLFASNSAGAVNGDWWC